MYTHLLLVYYLERVVLNVLMCCAYAMAAHNSCTYGATTKFATLHIAGIKRVAKHN